MNQTTPLDSQQSTDSRMSRDLASIDQIDLLCDEFEKAWLLGESPQIEVYLDRCGEAARDRVLAELLLVDRELRIRLGETASRCDYLQRFPEYSTEISNLEFPTIDERSSKQRTKLIERLMSVVGARLAHFELLEELGSGASGTVWKAKDSRLRRVVAIKIPRNGSLTDCERERFLREGQAAAQLQHPNIVTVYEVGEDHGQLFIVANFIDGLNLQEWLKQHEPRPREAAELAAQLAEALHHAHEQGVVHRDLKPANVLIDREGSPHITDFGLAKWSAETALMTVEGNILGTPAYMSPEQARGDAAGVDRRSDVYGLGALLYEMLTRQPPFQGDVATIVHQVIHDEPRTPRKIVHGIPRDLETICIKSMAKEACRRYPSAQEMAVDLRRYLRGEPILARRASVMERSWHWCKRRPLVFVAIILCAIALTVSAIAVSLARDNQILQGYRRVRIASEPPGAEIVFVRLDEQTGAPNLNQVSRAEAPSLIGNNAESEASLKAGDYLVVASFPDGRFSEVYRHVPNLNEGIPVVWKFAIWQMSSDGAITLPRISILEEFNPIGMVEIPISEAARRRNPALPNSLWIDVAESGPGFQSNGKPLVWIDDAEKGAPPFYHNAMETLEYAGKRLPSVAEYEAVAEFLPHGQAGDETSKIRNLRDGYWEWTTTRIALPGSEQRAVIGGSATEDHDGRQTTYAVPIEDNLPSIGFRGYRSGSPRFSGVSQ